MGDVWAAVDHRQGTASSITLPTYLPKQVSLDMEDLRNIRENKYPDWYMIRVLQMVRPVKEGRKEV